MSGKRAATHTLNEREIDSVNQKSEPVHLSSQAEIEGRKIFKIKSPVDDTTNSVSSKKVDFKLNASFDLPKQSLPDTKNPFGGNLFAPSLRIDPSKNIFGGVANIFTSNANTQNSAAALAAKSAATNKPQAPEVKPAAKEENKPVATPSIFGFSGSMFGNTVAQPQGNSLFGNSASASIFSSTGSLFGNSTTLSNNLFGQPKQDDDDEGDDENAAKDLQKDQALESDPSKSTGKYQYKSDFTALLSAKIPKYKKDGADLIENVLVVLGEHADKPDLHMISVHLQATRKSIFDGFIVPKVSKAKIFSNKALNVEVIAISFPTPSTPRPHTLRLQFEKQDEAKEGLKIIEKWIASADEEKKKKEDAGKAKK